MAEEINRLTVRILGDVTDLRKKMSQAERTVEQFGYNMTRLGKSLTVGLTVPLAAAGAAATKLAADAAEAANKFDVVFGASAGRARQRLEELHASIPLTRHELEGLSASLQDLLVPMGLARGEAADLSVQFLALAGDIASFNNISAEDALAAIRSGLAGESEPLRRFGVDVRAARLEALALSEGLIKTGETLNRTARAQAVFQAITQDSADAIGDAARTADEAANSFRFFLRNVKELGVNIGNVLLPAITPLVNKLNESLSAMGGLSDPTVRWAVAIGAVTAAVGPLLLVLGKFVQLAATLRPAIVGLAATLGVSTGGLAFVVAGLVAGLGFLATKFVESKLEAAAFARETKNAADRVKELDANATALALAEARRARDAANRRVAALQYDLANPGATTVSPDRLREELRQAKNEAIAAQRELSELRDHAMALQTIDPITVIAPRQAEEVERTSKALTSLAQAYRRAFGVMDGPMSPVPDYAGRDSTFAQYGGRAAQQAGAGGPSAVSALSAAGQYVPGLGGLAGIVSAFSVGGPLLGGISLVGEAFKGLSSIFEGGKSAAERFAISLQHATERLRAEFAVFGTGPEEQFQRVLETALDELSPMFAQFFEGLTPENLQQRFQAFLDFLDANKFNAAFVGADAARDFFVRLAGITDQMDAFGNALDRATRVLNAPSGFNLAWQRDAVASMGLGGGSSPGGIVDALPTRPGGGFYVENVNIDGNRDPREMWEDFKRGVTGAANSGDPWARNLTLGPA